MIIFSSAEVWLFFGRQWKHFDNWMRPCSSISAWCRSVFVGFSNRPVFHSICKSHKLTVSPTFPHECILWIMNWLTQPFAMKRNFENQSLRSGIRFLPRGTKAEHLLTGMDTFVWFPGKHDEEECRFLGFLERMPLETFSGGLERCNSCRVWGPPSLTHWENSKKG